jgi:hypothetical protein
MLGAALVVFGIDHILQRYDAALYFGHRLLKLKPQGGRLTKTPHERISLRIDDASAGGGEQHTHVFSLVGVGDRKGRLLAEVRDEVLHTSSHVVDSHISQIDFVDLIDRVILVDFDRCIGQIVLDNFRSLEDQSAICTGVDALDPVGGFVEVLFPGEIEHHRSIKHVRGSRSPDELQPVEYCLGYLHSGVGFLRLPFHVSSSFLVPNELLTSSYNATRCIAILGPGTKWKLVVARTSIQRSFHPSPSHKPKWLIR